MQESAGGQNPAKTFILVNNDYFSESLAGWRWGLPTTSNTAFLPPPFVSYHKKFKFYPAKHTHYFNSYFPGKPGLASSPLDF